MAGDWIKVRVLLRKDPRTIAMADRLAFDRGFISWLTDPVRAACKESAYEHVTRHVTVAVTVTGLVTVWGVTREQGRRDGEDLVVDCTTLERLDEVADVPGFGAAMGHVGWAVEEPENELVRFPKFFRDNVSTADRLRDGATERKRRQRERGERGKRDSHVTNSVTTSRDSHADVTHRGEERREEKKENRTSLRSVLAPPAGAAGVLPGIEPPPRKQTREPTQDQTDLATVRPIWLEAWIAKHGKPYAGLDGDGKNAKMRRAALRNSFKRLERDEAEFRRCVARFVATPPYRHRENPDPIAFLESLDSVRAGLNEQPPNGSRNGTPKHSRRPDGTRDGEYPEPLKFPSVFRPGEARTAEAVASGGIPASASGEA